MAQPGQFLYGVIETSHTIGFGPIGVAAPGRRQEGSSTVYTILHRGLGACVSDYPAGESVPANLENCQGYERVVSEIMKRHTILPFEFGTLAPSTEEVIRLLSVNHIRLKLCIRRLRGMVQVNLKAFWKDLKGVCQEIVEEDALIKRYRDEIASRALESTYKDRIAIGEMVASAVNKKRKSQAKEILSALRRFTVSCEEDMLLGSEMVLNCAFLVRGENFPRFESALVKLGEQHEGRMDFQYAGPLAPYQFSKMSLGK